MIRLSLNELKFAVRWAGLGAGAPAGLADDLAAAALALACLDVDPLAPVLRALTDLPADHVWGGLRVNRRGDGLCLSAERSPPTIVELGPAFADAAMLAPGQTIETGPVAAPILSAGYLRSAGVTDAVLHGPGFRASFDASGAVVLVVTNTDQAATSAPAALRLEPAMGAMPPPAAAATPIQAVEQGVPAHEEAWARMRGLTARAWVKATERSRLSGAGAGLVDTD